MNSIEPLESRIAPSVTVMLTGSVLHIDHTAASGADNLKIEESTPGKFAVSDTMSATDYGAFEGVKSIDVKLGDTDDVVVARFSSAGLAGALSIATGIGTNAVTLEGVGGTGRINGAVKITGDAGKDALHINNLTTKGNVTFIGEGDADSVDGGGFIIGKTLFIDNVENTTFQSSSPVVMGSLNIDQDEAAAAVVFVLNDSVTVRGKLTYCGTPTFDDTVTVIGQVGGAALMMLDEGKNTVKLAARMAGTLTITGGAGKDSILFTNSSTALGGAPTIPDPVAIHAKAVKMTLGAGDNSVTIENAAAFYDSVSVTTTTGTDSVSLPHAFIQKNLKLNLGAGDNTLNVGDSLVGGGLTYVGGNGQDSVSIFGLTADKVSITLGDGVNSVSGSPRITGKSVTILGGKDADTVNIGLSSFQAILTVKLAAGMDSLTYTGGPIDLAKLDGGADGDTITGTSLLPAGTKFPGFETMVA
jgi:hypothetical protein